MEENKMAGDGPLTNGSWSNQGEIGDGRGGWEWGRGVPVILLSVAFRHVLPIFILFVSHIFLYLAT